MCGSGRGNETNVEIVGHERKTYYPGRAVHKWLKLQKKGGIYYAFLWDQHLRPLDTDASQGHLNFNNGWLNVPGLSHTVLTHEDHTGVHTYWAVPDALLGLDHWERQIHNNQWRPNHALNIFWFSHVSNKKSLHKMDSDLWASKLFRSTCIEEGISPIISLRRKNGDSKCEHSRALNNDKQKVRKLMVTVKEIIGNC